MPHLFKKQLKWLQIMSDYHTDTLCILKSAWFFFICRVTKTRSWITLPLHEFPVCWVTWLSLPEFLCWFTNQWIVWDQNTFLMLSMTSTQCCTGGSTKTALRHPQPGANLIHPRGRTTEEFSQYLCNLCPSDERVIPKLLKVFLLPVNDESLPVWNSLRCSFLYPNHVTDLLQNKIICCKMS